MRFDTRFYLALLPPNQTPLRRSEEVTDSVWIKPDEALARNSDYDFPLIPPTTTVLGIWLDSLPGIGFARGLICPEALDTFFWCD